MKRSAKSYQQSSEFRRQRLNASWCRTLNDFLCSLAAWRKEYNCEAPVQFADYRTLSTSVDSGQDRTAVSGFLRRQHALHGLIQSHLGHVRGEELIAVASKRLGSIHCHVAAL